MSKKQTKRELRRLEAAAYHEAGHALAAYVVHRRITGVSIVPDEDTLGGCSFARDSRNFDPEVDTSPRVRNLIEKRAITLWGGHIAETRFTGRNNWVGSEADRNRLTGILIYLCASKEETGAYMEWLRTRTKALIERHWVGVEALASALVDKSRIGGRTATQIIRVAVIRRTPED